MNTEEQNKLTEEIKELKTKLERMRYGISDALALLQPQTKVMNPSLLVVREAVSILRAKLPY